MISLSVILLIVWLHFISDFLLQTDKIALNKSKDNVVLLIHVIIYSILFFGFGWKFAVANATLHFITDYFTSRLTSYLWKNDQRHWFFVTIGFDQAVHMTCLFATYALWIK